MTISLGPEIHVTELHVDSIHFADRSIINTAGGGGGFVDNVARLFIEQVDASGEGVTTYTSTRYARPAALLSWASTSIGGSSLRNVALEKNKNYAITLEDAEHFDRFELLVYIFYETSENTISFDTNSSDHINLKILLVKNATPDVPNVPDSPPAGNITLSFGQTIPASPSLQRSYILDAQEFTLTGSSSRGFQGLQMNQLIEITFFLRAWRALTIGEYDPKQSGAPRANTQH